jgi:hypothetical protein
LTSSTAALAALEAARSTWLADAVELLRDDVRVVGLLLVGSLGRNDADEWSDVDAVVVVEDATVGQVLADATEAARFGRTIFPVEPWHANVVGGVTYAAATYECAGWPVWVDWHVHPASRAVVTVDAEVVFAHRPLRRRAVGFETVVREAGLAGQTVPRSESGRGLDAWRLSLLPIAAKYYARGAPSIASMIELVGGTIPSAGGARAEMEALWDVLEQHQHAFADSTVAPIERVLRLAAARREAAASD